MKKINKCIVYFFLVLAIVFIEENICVAGDSQYAGLGTKENPYLISTIKQLDNIRLDLNAHYALTCNLVFSEIDFLEDGEFYNAGKGWLPIALDEDNMFKGSLNGNGHSIKGLFFKNDCDIISLFGYSSGSIYDLNIENSTVDGEDVNAAGLVVYNYGIIQNCSFSGKINGYGHVGGIAAMNFGVISNCESNGEVYSEGTVKPDLNSGYTYGSSSIGGVCGANEGSITNSINKAVVLANLSSPNKDATISVSAGGVCGNNKGLIKECCNLGNVYGEAYHRGGKYTYAVVGGIVSQNWYGDISNSYNAGKLIASNASSRTVGGIIGENIYDYLEGGNVNCCYNVGYIDSSSLYGAIIGENTPKYGSIETSTISNCYYLDNCSVGVGTGKGDMDTKQLSEKNMKVYHYIWFYGFDLENIWLAESNSYLKLRNIGVERCKDGHSYTSTITQEATCWREGVKTYTCTCGDSYTEAIAKLDHEYRPWETKKNPTCTEPGLEWSYCLICDNDFEREIPATGHTIIDYTRRATPDSDGAYVTACDVCNEVFKSISFGRPAEYKLSTTTYTYNGKAKTPKLTITTSDGKVLKKGVDYTVELPDDRKTVGVHTYRVVFMGDYLGETKVSYQILPGKTSSVSGSQSTDYIKLTWKKVTGATGYRVYQYDSSTGKYKTLKTLTGTSYTVKNLKAGTTYKFAVKAYTKDGGETLWAASSKTLTTATKPATPTVKATAGSGKATLSWNKVTGATGYVVYMMDEFGDYVKVGSTKKNSYTVTDLDYGKTYNFRVKAYKTAGDKNVYSGYKTVKVTTLYPAVYVTPSGKRYHYDKECAGKNATKTTLANAKKTKTPCKTCVL